MNPAFATAAIATMLLIGGAFAKPSPTGETPVARRASGNIVIVSIDDASLAEIGPWPWNRRVHADLVDALTRAGVRRIAFDIVFDRPSADPADDIALADALKRATARPLLAAWPTQTDPVMPNSVLAREGTRAYVAVALDENGVAATAPSMRDMPSMAAQISNRPDANQLPVDWSIDRSTIPVVSAADVLAGRLNDLRGRTVLIASTAPRLGDMHTAPTGESLPGGFLIVLAAEAQVELETERSSFD